VGREPAVRARLRELDLVGRDRIPELEELAVEVDARRDVLALVRWGRVLLARGVADARSGVGRSSGRILITSASMEGDSRYLRTDVLLLPSST
jgi:hypothetical protein